MSAIKFYKETKDHLEAQAKEKNVADLQKYYNCETSRIECISGMEGISQVFAQIAFHATERQRLDNIIGFYKNYKAISEITFEFKPKEFLNKYNDTDEEEKAKNFAEILAEKLNRTFDRDNIGNRKPLILQYAYTLLDAAKYLQDFESREEVRDDLLKNYTGERKVENVVRYFCSKIKHGFGVALTCNFLKEFDNKFCDLANPCRHIVDIMCAYHHCESGNYTGNDRNTFQCIRDMQKLTNEINEKLSNNKITVYQLDRMIWLCCTGAFYLDGYESQSNRCKQEYINIIKNRLTEEV